MRLPAGLRTNLGLKLLSVALALLLWSFVRGSKIVEREHTIPIHYVNLPDSLLFLETPPQAMRVLVAGPVQEMLLGRLNVMRDVAARIDLSGAAFDLDRVVPSLSDIGAPEGDQLAVVRILSPSVIAFRLARRVQRALPVLLTLQSDDRRGFCLADSPVVRPARVVCVGPEPLLDRLQAVATQPLVLPARRGRISAEIALAYDAAELKCVPDRVEVTFASERLRSRTLDHVPLTLVPPAQAGLQVALDATEATLTVAGPEPVIEALAAADLGLYLDASHLAPGRHDSVAVIAQLPGWVELVTLEPRAVELTVWGRGSRSPDSVQAKRGTELP